MSEASEFVWEPMEGPQTEFLRRKEFECFYGGAAGGGKTDAILGDCLKYVDHPKYRFLILRRTFRQLAQGGGIIDRSQSLFRQLGATFIDSKKEWHFPSGAVGYFGHMESEADRFNYQGGQYHRIYFDELTQFTEIQYRYLFSRVRVNDVEILPGIRATGNPGGIGHMWVKQRFVDNGAFNSFMDPDSRLHRVFVPARVFDNPFYNPDDPRCIDANYVRALMTLPAEERRMLLEGDWDVFAGQFFYMWRPELHVVDRWKTDEFWSWGFGVDFGVRDPFVLIEGAVGVNSEIYDEAPIIYIANEYWDVEKSPTFNARAALKSLTLPYNQYQIKVIGKDAKKRMPQKDEATSEVTVLDLLAEGGLVDLELANNNRVQGWSTLSDLLSWEGSSTYAVKRMPRIRINRRCKKLIDTLPSLVRDPHNVDDVDQASGSDHWAEALRYLVMHLYNYKIKRPVRDRFRSRDIEEYKARRENRLSIDRGYLV